LDSFFVFNPTLGGELTEGEKILYYHPNTTELNKQKTFVGLVEGLSGFCRYTNIFARYHLIWTFFEFRKIKFKTET